MAEFFNTLSLLTSHGDDDQSMLGNGFRYLVWAHALYMLLTGVWPLVSIDTFMMVTGPKTDIWLVKTVGALLIPISLTMIASLKSEGNRTPLFLLGTTTALAFMTIDIYYAVHNVISDIYLADAAVQVLLFAGWIFFWLRTFNQAT